MQIPSRRPPRRFRPAKTSRAAVPGKDRRSGVDIPNGEKPATGWPAITFNHGFIEPDVYRTTECYVAYVDGLARSGYIVLHSISSDAC
jgi:hypothetical protein